MAVSFGLQIVQGAVRKLQLAFLECVRSREKVHPENDLYMPVPCIDLGALFLVQGGDRHVQNSPRGRLPGASGSPQAPRLSAPHHATFFPIPPRLVKIKIVR